MSIFERHFSLEEATALMPDVRRLLLEVRAEIERLDADDAAIPRSLESIRTNGGGKRLESAFEASDTIRDHLAEVVRLGVQIKDVRQGLVDFPALRDGEEILLCWLIDEPAIAYWHDLESGFGGRQQL